MLKELQIGRGGFFLLFVLVDVISDTQIKDPISHA